MWGQKFLCQDLPGQEGRQETQSGCCGPCRLRAPSHGRDYSGSGQSSEQEQDDRRYGGPVLEEDQRTECGGR